MIGKKCMATTLLLGILLMVTRPASCDVISGEIGASPKWGSGWLDLSKVQKFHKGDKLRLKIGGSAGMILVRVLRQGEDPSQPVGIVGDPVKVPSNKIVEVTLDQDVSHVVHISVHGKANPFGMFDLGANNGPATLLKCDYITADNQDHLKNKSRPSSRKPR